MTDEESKAMALTVVFDITTDQIESKRNEYALLDASTPKGYKEVTKAIGECRGLRVRVEKCRKNLKAGALEYGAKVDTAARQLRELAEYLKDPLKLKKTVIDDEKARAKLEKEEAERKIAEEKERLAREVEEKRLADIKAAEDARIAAECEKLRLEREAFEKEQAAAEAMRVAEEKKRAELRAVEDAKRKAEQDAKEKERLGTIAAESAMLAIQLEVERSVREENRAIEKAELDKQRAAIEAAKEDIRQREQEAARVAKELEAGRLAALAEMDRLAAAETKRLAASQVTEEAAGHLERGTEELVSERALEQGSSQGEESERRGVPEMIGEMRVDWNRSGGVEEKEAARLEGSRPELEKLASYRAKIVALIDEQPTLEGKETALMLIKAVYQLKGAAEELRAK